MKNPLVSFNGILLFSILIQKILEEKKLKEKGGKFLIEELEFGDHGMLAQIQLTNRGAKLPSLVSLATPFLAMHVRITFYTFPCLPHFLMSVNIIAVRKLKKLEGTSMAYLW